MKRFTPFLLLTAVLAFGCTPSAKPTAEKPNALKSRVQLVSGVWKGAHKEDADHPKEGGSSNFLAKHLGGYSIRLLEDGQFLADWRGLTKEGTWKLDGDTVNLTTLRVLGKDKTQAEAENKSQGKPVNDLSQYDKDKTLALSVNDSVLTLTSGEKGTETVVFKKSGD